MADTWITIGLAATFALLVHSSHGHAQSNFDLSEIEIALIDARGTLSGQAERCGLDWKNLNFIPMMRHWRGIGKSEQQTAYIAVLHGVAQNTAPGIPCTPTNMDNLRKQLKFQPQE
jgi:hypothetical protein